MLNEIIKEHIKNCGKSRYRISVETGINQSVLCRFLQGEGCTTRNADILLKYFGLTIVKKAKRKEQGEL